MKPKVMLSHDWPTEQDVRFHQVQTSVSTEHCGYFVTDPRKMMRECGWKGGRGGGVILITSQLRPSLT